MTLLMVVVAGMGLSVCVRENGVIGGEWVKLWWQASSSSLGHKPMFLLRVCIIVVAVQQVYGKVGVVQQAPND